jgi:hypothetical protein
MIVVTTFIVAILFFSGSVSIGAYVSDEAGKQFYGSVVDGWKRALLEAPYVMGRARSTTTGPETNFEYLHSKGHHLYTYEHADGTGFWNFSNPKYYAAISKNAKGNSVSSLTQSSLPDAGYRLSPFNSTSIVGFFSIPKLVEQGALKISNLETGSTTQITFTPTTGSDLNIKKVVVEFDPRYPGLPVSSWHTLLEGEIVVMAKFEAFDQIEGFFLPTKIVHSQKTGDGLRSMVSVVEYFPNETLDPAQCYVEYYDIASPDLRIAERGSSWGVLFWSSLAIIVLSLVVFFWVRWSR